VNHITDHSRGGEEEEEAAEEYSSSRGDHDTPQHRRL